MIDGALVAKLARELGGIELEPDTAHVIATDAVELFNTLQRERERLEFEDAPYAVDAMRRL